jgi:hypothetical protein
VDGGFQMTKKLSKSQIKELEKNPNVIRVNDHTITYHPDFKLKAVRENLKGTTPAQIFEEHGFTPDIIGKDIPQTMVSGTDKKRKNQNGHSSPLVPLLLLQDS